jgi:hypothetical protein
VNAAIRPFQRFLPSRFFMARNVRNGYWVRLALAAISAVLFVVTLVWHDWVELVFRIDPDHGGGWLEWLIVIMAFGFTMAFSISARREWRRSSPIVGVGDGVS